MNTADPSLAAAPIPHAEDYPFLGQGKAPLEVAAAEGCYMITPDGRRILDAAGGAIVSNIGHGRREVAEAYAQAAAQTDYIVPPFATPARTELVHRMRTRWLPGDINRVLFASGGSEAMDLAIRFARQHHLSAGRPERWRVFGRQLSYHGATMATLAVGGHQGRRAGFEHWLVDEQTDQPRPPAHYCMRCPLGKTFPGCDIACADEVERVFEEIGPEEIAAFVVEPIVGSNAGALVPPGDYLERVARICRRHGILLIADEVMTGYGRTGRKFGVDHWDVVPDILVGGKGLTGGYAPLVAICARDEGHGAHRGSGRFGHVLHLRRPLARVRGGQRGAAHPRGRGTRRTRRHRRRVARRASAGDLRRSPPTSPRSAAAACSTASRSSRTARRWNRSPPSSR